MERVKIVKLVITPSVIPRGFRFPPEDEAESTIGNSGQMHGAKMVTMPARKENKSNMVMFNPPLKRVIDPEPKMRILFGLADRVGRVETDQDFF